MYNTNPFTKRSNGASWPTAFADLDAQLNAVFSNLPAIFEGLSAPSGNARYAVKPRWRARDDAYHAELDLPGVKPEDVEVEWKDGAVAIKGVRKPAPEAEASADAAEDRERVYQAVLRVPEDVDVNGIAARCEHGVLSLTFPKSEKAKPRRIEIK